MDGKYDIIERNNASKSTLIGKERSTTANDETGNENRNT